MRRFIQLLLIAFWVGGGTILMTVAAPAAFRHAPDSRIAGDIVGGMLSRWRLLALLIPFTLLAIDFVVERTRPRTILLIAAILLAGSQMLIDARVHRMRAESPVPIGSLEANDPVRRQFGMLHGISWMLMLGNVLTGAGVLYSLANSEQSRPYLV